MNNIVEIRPDIAANLQSFIAHVGDRLDNSHGPLTIPVLVQMLLGDVALAMRNPKSREAELVKNLLEAHGYRLREE